ncbi:hypothetical protein, partial [Bacillus sp. J33]|uniref:hypothetical protein n=1 Tax=Bacillus sp. J33 TaxID=935836 RepID=UPI001E4899F5
GYYCPLICDKVKLPSVVFFHGWLVGDRRMRVTQTLPQDKVSSDSDTSHDRKQQLLEDVASLV